MGPSAGLIDAKFRRMISILLIHSSFDIIFIQLTFCTVAWHKIPHMKTRVCCGVSKNPLGVDMFSNQHN